MRADERRQPLLPPVFRVVGATLECVGDGARSGSVMPKPESSTPAAIATTVNAATRARVRLP